MSEDEQKTNYNRMISMEHSIETLKTKNSADYSLMKILGLENKEILRFENNGDIYLHGEMVENDKAVIDGFREFLTERNLYI